MFFSSFDFLRGRVKKIHASIEAGNLDKALFLIYDFVDQIIMNPFCTGQVFSSKVLDDCCLEIGKRNLFKLNAGDVEKNKKNSEKLYIYIVTKIQNSGGHSKIIENFIHERKKDIHLVLSTELDGSSDVDYFLDLFPKNNLVFFESAPKGRWSNKLSWLQKNLLVNHPEAVYLFNNHADSIAVSAVPPDLHMNVYYYHHADHHLALGSSCIQHFDHLDSHPARYHQCREKGIKNIFIPLSVEDKGKKEGQFKKKGHLVTCSAARSNKLEAPYFIAYPDVISEMLCRTQGEHIHIGRLSPWVIRSIYKKLHKKGVSPQKFIYIPWVQSVWDAMKRFEVDLFVGSFPYVGGLTLVEAMGAGIPLAIHQHISSRMLGGVDLVYPGVFCWRDPEELWAYCAHVRSDELESSSQRSREHYERYYSHSRFKSAFHHPNETADVSVPPLLEIPFEPQMDEWAGWIQQQMGIKKQLAREVYSFLRRCRAKLAW